ncbi:MAG: alpha/beta hydrolase, partial [Bacteroidota bacterium]
RVPYETRLALAVLRDYPETVRAALLDSVLPPDARYDDESVQNLAASLDLVFRDCAADAGCNAAYPDLQKGFYEALDRADTTPLEVFARTEAGPVSRRLSGADLAGLVSLSSTWGITNAPMLIDGIARRDTALIAPRLAAGRGSGLAWGMRLSVWCGEAQPHARRATADGPDGTLNGMESAVVLPAVCDAWNVPVRPKREVEPVSSDVPTLLIAGEYDPDTPPAWAYRAATTLTNSRVHVVRGAGHAPIQDWGGDGCAMQVAAAFVADPVREINASAPAGGCLSEREAPSFVLPPAPEPEAEPARYLIYFHGRIVEDGLPAISPRFGEYEYEAILKRFEDEGFTVLSEQRPPNAEVTVHAERAVAQVDSLMRLGVEPASISLVGASKGAYIASLAAHVIEEPELNVVLLAGCSAGVVQYMQAEHIDLYGRVLTVRDIADTELAGSCAEVFAFSDGVSAHEELVVEVGNGHGLIYRPLDAWVKPMLTWIDQ